MQAIHLVSGEIVVCYIALYADHNMMALVLGQEKGAVLATETTHFTSQKQPSCCVHSVWEKMFQKYDVPRNRIRSVQSCVEPGYPTLRSVVHGFLQGTLTAMPHALWHSISWVDYAKALCLKLGATAESLLVMRKNGNDCSCFVVGQKGQEPIVMTWHQVERYVSDQKADQVLVWGDKGAAERNSPQIHPLILCGEDWRNFLQINL